MSKIIISQIDFFANQSYFDNSNQKMSRSFFCNFLSVHAYIPYEKVIEPLAHIAAFQMLVTVC